MSSSAVATAPLNFAQWASRMVSMATDLGTKPEREILDHAPSWVACHAGSAPGNVVLEVPRNHPHWNQKLERAIRDKLKFHKNARGHKAELTVTMV